MKAYELSFIDTDFILGNYQTMTGSEMARRIGVGKGIIYKFLKAHNISTPKEVVFSERAKVMRSKTSATPQMDMIIRMNYLQMPSKRLAEFIGKSDVFLRTRLRQLNLSIPPELIEQRKKDSQIKKGNVPPNKGKKMSAEIYAKAKPTMFKKGQTPVNTLEDGIITIRHPHKNRNGKKYKFIRISQGKWKHLHVHVWEQNHGPVPDGLIIVFKDGNSMNCDIENLEMITRSENMKRNSIVRYPEELRSVITINTHLKKILNKIEGKWQSKGKHSMI